MWKLYASHQTSIPPCASFWLESFSILTLLYKWYPQEDIINQEYIKGLARFLQGQSAAQIDDVCSCVFRPPFTQVIKSCWKVSGFILRTVWDRISQHQSAHAFSNENILSLLLCSTHIFSPVLSVSQTLSCICLLISVCLCLSSYFSSALQLPLLFLSLPLLLP